MRREILCRLRQYGGNFYESIEKTNTYENDLKDIDEQIKSIENKKSKAIELIYDGIISISRECFVEPKIHEKIKKMPSGRKKVISKRIPISVDYGKMLEEGLIKVENCSNCWQVTEGKIHIDVMVCHILFYVFRKYQEEGKIPEHISYNV